MITKDIHKLNYANQLKNNIKGRKTDITQVFYGYKICKNKKTIFYLFEYKYNFGLLM